MSPVIAVRHATLIVMMMLLTAPAAALASGQDVIDDCTTHGKLTHKYSQAEYKSALSELPADVDEYTDCRDIIRNARLNGASGTGGGDSGGTSAKRKHRISKHNRDQIGKDLGSTDLAAATPLRIGNSLVDPDSLSSNSSIPAPLIAVLILTAIGGLGAAGIGIRRFVSDRRK